MRSNTTTLALVAALLALVALATTFARADDDDRATANAILPPTGGYADEAAFELELEAGPIPSDQLFVERNGKVLQTSDGRPYRYVGMNYWQGANLGSPGPGGDRDRLLRELDQLASRGITNLRIMAGSEGPNDAPYRVVPAMQIAPGVYDEAVLEGLDFLLSEMGKRKMRAVMCLSNEWLWSGGLAQYLIWAKFADEIPSHPPGPNSWEDFMHFTSNFFENKEAVALYDAHLRFMVGRNNTITGQAYAEDPTIMTWELANEPRGMAKGEAFFDWVQSTSKLIKALDPNHLVTIGLEGDTIDPKYNGINFELLNSPESIDYTTIHIWVENWKWYNPYHAASTYPQAKEKALNYFQDHSRRSGAIGKPMILEEFGMARDSNTGKSRYLPSTGVTWRDHFFDNMLSWVCLLGRDPNSAVVGANLWAYGGEAGLAPSDWTPGGLWRPGDILTGDPPHEAQGWYSIYSTDNSTLDVIEKYARCITPAKQ